MPGSTSTDPPPPFLTKQMRPNGKGVGGRGLGLQITKGINIAYERRPTQDMTHSNHGSLLSNTVSEINGDDGQNKAKCYYPCVFNAPAEGVRVEIFLRRLEVKN